MKKWPIILLFASAVALNGCVVAGVVAAASLFDKRGLATRYNDHNISYTVLTTIAQNKPLAKSTNVQVHTYDGNVLLTGQAQTADLRNQVESIPAHIKGVQKIYNQIEIASSTDHLETANDAWLTSKTRSKLLAQKGINGLPVEIVTTNSVVYLMGRCTREQGDEIAEVVRRVSGVKRVVKVFEYTDINS